MYYIIFRNILYHVLVNPGLYGAFRQSLTVARALGPLRQILALRWPSESGRQSLRAGRAPTIPPWLPLAPGPWPIERMREM